MTTKEFLVNNGSHREAVEAICECLPHTNVVTTLAFVIKPVKAVNRGTLMISSQQEEVLRVLDLVH